MAGCIVMFCGLQRSGKTLLAYMVAEQYHQLGVPVYSNMDVEGWQKLRSLAELPFNFEPKVLLLDEAYFFLDSRQWKDNTDASIFFNTLGKQNVLLLLTSISPDMVDKRIRQQLNYCFLAKGDSQRITYKFIDPARRRSRVFVVPKTPRLFAGLRYDTQQIPDIVTVDVRSFVSKVRRFNMTYRYSEKAEA